MAAQESRRIFVGRLSRETMGKDLENAFSPFGEVKQAEVIMDKVTGRHRGFGYVTFFDPRAVESAVREMHGKKLDGRVIKVSKANPKPGTMLGYGDRGGWRHGSGGDRSSDCFKCGKPGHWVRECPSHVGRPTEPDHRYNPYNRLKEGYDRYGSMDCHSPSRGYVKGRGESPGRMYGVQGGGLGPYYGGGDGSDSVRSGTSGGPLRRGWSRRESNRDYEERSGPYDHPVEGARSLASRDYGRGY